MSRNRLKKFFFVLIIGVVYGFPLRNVGVYDPQVIEAGHDQPIVVFAVVAIGKAVDNLAGLVLACYGNACICLPAPKKHVVSPRIEGPYGKLIVGHLGFLKAKHVYRIFLKPPF